MQTLGCGVAADKPDSFVEFRVSKISDIINKIIPFLNQYPLQGIKLLDYQDFCKVAALMKDKAHLTVSDL